VVTLRKVWLRLAAQAKLAADALNINADNSAAALCLSERCNCKACHVADCALWAFTEALGDLLL
jgi:hypothetical protein